MQDESREFRLSDLSDICYKISSSPCRTDAARTILIVAFVGNYRDGSAGRGDAQFMAAVIERALTASSYAGLVIDLRELAYEWGDDVLDLLYGDFQQLPAALVTSPRNHAALESLQATGLRPLFGTDSAHPLGLALDEALVNVEDRVL